MSKKALAIFTLAVAGSGFMPGAALAHADEAPKPNAWVLPTAAAVDAHDAQKALKGADFTITVETRDSVKDEWKDAAKEKPSDSKEQGQDALAQAQKLVGEPTTVQATKEEDALLRVTYREAATPENYWGNDDAITLYEVADGWVQATNHDDSDRENSDQVKFTKAEDKETAKVEFSNEPYLESAAPTASASESPSAAPTATATPTEASATPSASSTSAPSATSTASEKAAPSATPSAKDSVKPSTAPTQAAHSVVAKSPLALPKTGMKAATSAYTIDGTVFIDTNKNGAFDSTEKAAANRTVVLKNELDQSIVAMRTTDASGHYSFGSLQKGTYSLAVNPSNGSTITSVWGNTSTDRAVVIVNDTMNSSTVDFGVSGGKVKDKHELENGKASANSSDSNSSSSSSDTSSSTSTPSSASTPSATPSTSTVTGTQVIPAPGSTADSSSDGSQTVVNSGDVPNSVNGGALAAGVGFLGGAGVLTRLGLRRKR